LDYGKALRIARAAAGLQQQELAKKAGLTPGYISLVEMGRRNPSPGALRKLSRALGIPPHVLTLLATESEDTDLLDQREIESIGNALLRLVLNTRRDDNRTLDKKGKSSS
jgi:transcriptional regulator with XRE-family HTH domain